MQFEFSRASILRDLIVFRELAKCITHAKHLLIVEYFDKLA